MVNITGVEFGITTSISLTCIISNIALIKMVVSLLVVLILVIRLFAPTSCFIVRIGGKHPVLILMSYIGRIVCIICQIYEIYRFVQNRNAKMDSQNVLAILAGREHMINDKQSHLN